MTTEIEHVAPQEPERLAVVPKPKPVKFRVEEIQPSSIVDVWRLYEQSLKLSPPSYPDFQEESSDLIRSQIFYAISTFPNFIGFIAKQGRRPIGQVLGLIQGRPFGHPRVYLHLWIVWVDPAFRKQGVGKALTQAIGRKAKQGGVHHFEGSAYAGQADQFLGFGQGSAKLAYQIFSGKIPQE